MIRLGLRWWLLSSSFTWICSTSWWGPS